MKAKSIKGKSKQEIQTALEQSIADGFKPTLAIVFISARQDREAVCSILDKENISVFGATTAGEFIDADFDRDSIVILLLDINPDNFKITFREADYKTSREVANSIAVSGMNEFPNPGFILAIAGRMVNAVEIINGIQDKVGTNAFIYGGLAGNTISGAELFVFDNKKITNSGLIALIIDHDKINMTGFATSGWQPIATFHTVTKSEDNTIYTIDDKPAMDMIAQYLGISFDADDENEKIYSDDARPIQLYRDNASSVLREITFFNRTTRTVNFAGPVPQGSKFRFSLPPDWDIVEKIKSDCLSIKQQQKEADALIVFSCASRLQSLGPMVKNEIEEIINTWDCPVAGFFCFGEIGNYLGGNTEYHNNTCSIVVLKEK